MKIQFLLFYIFLYLFFCIFPQKNVYAQKHFHHANVIINNRHYDIKYIIHPAKKIDKKHHEKQGKRIVKKEYITFHLQTSTEKDSILKTTFNKKPKVGYTFTDDHPYANRGFLNELLLLLHIHDSATFYIPVASLYDAIKKNPPKFLRNHQYVKYTIKVLEARNIAQVDAEKAQILFDKQKRDNEILAKYVAKNPSPLWKKTYTGVWYQMINEGSGDFPVKGDVVSVMYKAYTLENQDQEYASSDQDGRNLEFPIGEKFVMPFLDEIMFLLKKGARAKFYVPAHLAHDEMWVGDIVAPNTCVMWQIDFVDIIAHKIVIQNKGEILEEERKKKEKEEKKNEEKKKKEIEERNKNIEKDAKKKLKIN